METTLLNTPAAAKRLGVMPSTLERWRCKGTGPSWIRVGHQVRYRPEAIEAYLDIETRLPVPQSALRAPKALLGAA